MDLRGRVLTSIVSQLGQPRGLPGRVLGRLLNRANRAATIGAVDTLDIPPEAVLADFGFGGGVGLEILLLHLGVGGQVHGVDRSTAMVDGAARRFRGEITSGRLVLHEGLIERLPLASASIDGAITLNTLYFIANLAGALHECARVLRPSGQLVVGLTDPETMARHPLADHGLHVRPMALVIEALLQAGLEIDQYRRVGAGDGAFHLLVAQPL
jgi:arsenite methyltransferase